MIRFVLFAAYLALIIYTVIDLLNSNRSSEQKLIWALLIVLFPIAGCLIYLLISRGVIKL